MNDHRLATIYYSQGILPAQVVKAKLDSAGIPAMLKYEAAGQIFGLTVDGLGRVEVLVPAQWADEARALVAENDEADLEND